MTTNLHDKMLAAIDAYFSASDAVEEELVENLLLDVRDEINKHKLAEQPAQQKPMAWIERDMNCDDFDPDSVTCQKPDISSAGWEWVPLYTTPQAQPAREPLTDEQIAVIAAACGGLASDFVISVARAIEAAHGIKE